MAYVCVNRYFCMSEGQCMVCVCRLQLDAWFKSFAEGEHFDCNAACSVLKRESAAAFRLVNCQDWSVKGGPLSERGGGPTRGVLEEEGLWWTSWFFESPLCGLLQQRGPPSHEEEREGHAQGKVLAWGMGRMPAHPFKSYRSDVPCHGALGL